jgi:Ner family transcriptional regulator
MRVTTQPKKPAPQADWHKADIKARLEKAGWTIRQLADHHDLCESTLRTALSASYPASQQRIADALGVHPMTIWPSRYDSEGNPLRGGRAQQLSTQAAANRSGRLRRGRAKGASSN